MASMLRPYSCDSSKKKINSTTILSLLTETLSLTQPNASLSFETFSTLVLTLAESVQVLSGHDKAVTCVAISTELDVAASGSEDGTVNVYTIKEGQYMRTVTPNTAQGPDGSQSPFMVSNLKMSYQGHLVFSGHTKDTHSVHTFTINGHPLHSEIVGHRYGQPTQNVSMAKPVDK